MYKLETALSAHVLNGRFFITKDRLTTAQEIPTTDRYEILGDDDPGEEMFFTSKGWKKARRMKCTHEEWQLDVNYPFPFMTSLLITRPELAKDNRTIKPLKLMYLDIETQSDGSGRFPRANMDPMIMFGYAIDDGEIHIHYIPNLKDRPKGIEDADLLREFYAVIEKEDPDVIVTYNGWGFDIPYILERSRKLERTGIKGVSINPLLRCDNLTPEDRQILIDTHCPTGKLNGNIGGRVHYDIYNVDVIRDQKLSGVKDRKMKTIGKWFLKDIAEDIIDLEDGISNTRQMMLTPDGLEKMIAYLKSDITVTRGLSKVYFPINITAANELGLPLNTVLNRTNGTLASIHILKEILAVDIIPDKANRDLFPELYSLVEANKDLDKAIKKSFQGAYVDLFKKGMYKKLWKLDFSSLYPSIIILFNLSYETVQFKSADMRHLPGKRENHHKLFTSDIRDHEIVLNIPDSNYMRIMPVTVDTVTQGIVPRILMAGLAKRKRIRAEMKDLDKNDPRYTALDSSQNIVKVINNSCFGILSNQHSMGYLPIGFTITGLGRALIRDVIEMISDPTLNLCETSNRVKGEPWSDEWKATSPIVEVDTDGLIIEGEPDVERVNALITEHIFHDFGIKNEVLKMEKEEFGSGYIHGMKNYLLLEPGKDKPIVHGSFFKSSRSAPVIDRVIPLLIDHLLYNKISAEEVINRAKNIDDAKPEDYKIKVRMSKAIKEYANKGGSMILDFETDDFVIQEVDKSSKPNMIIKLAEGYKDAYGFTPLKGDVLEFVVAKDMITGKQVQIPYNKMVRSAIYSIDKTYYLEAINRLLEPVSAARKTETNLLDIWEM
jgi:DNA polymerase elongation subunit (family B)